MNKSDIHYHEYSVNYRRTCSSSREFYGGKIIAVSSEENNYTSKQTLVAKDAQLCTFTMNENTTVYIFGGEPFPEERTIY